jgi:predicted dehydrogenase
VIGPLAEIAQACDLTPPPEHIRPFGIVGAGAILDAAHLPAYRAAGIPVPAIWGRNRESAERFAEKHGIPRVHDTLDGLLADTDVDVIDIAVAPQAQMEIALQALDAGKDLLCQKPLALDIREAERIVQRAEERGRTVVVQQQMRYEEGILAAREMVRRGWIGEVATITFTIDLDTDFSGWGWLRETEHMDLLFHSIHYLDTVRAFLGEPEQVFGRQWRLPGQDIVGETRTLSILDYAPDQRAIVHTNHMTIAGDNEARFRIDGSEGSIRGTLGLLIDYPHGRPDTLELWSRALPTDGWLPYPVTRRWVPDAFLGPVSSLLRALAEGGEPESSARDNLRTLRLVHALYESGEAGCVVKIGEDQAT